MADNEGALSKRERLVTDRERAVLLREAAASRRDHAFANQEREARAKTVNEVLGAANMREANQNLVTAAMSSQTAAETAERDSRLKEEFLAMLSHELRNPLSPILNAVAILELISNKDPQLPWIHDIIKRQIDQMTRLLDDLLDVARVTSGKILLQKRPIAVGSFLGQAIETTRTKMETRRQRFTLDALPEPIYVDGDLARLTQVFGNLLNNASKYTGEGGVIALSVEKRGTQAVLRVTDSGCGMRAEDLSRVFDLFTQADRSLARDQGGLGIGLTVVRRLVELHGGTVTAESAGLNQGSKFAVTLPLFEADPESASDAEARAPAAGRKYRIVLIDDHMDAAEVMGAPLQMMGHEVLTASDGVAGLALVESSRPEVVLCDIGLPGMDGYEVATKLRERFQGRMPCMIALTGYGRPQDRARALSAGFDIHLVKPVDPERLMQRIAEYFENREDG